MVPPSLHLVVQVLLQIVVAFLGISLHPIRMVPKVAKTVNEFLNMFLAGFGSHNHMLLLVNIEIEIADRFMPADGNEYDPLKP